jgi:uncharacterized protein
VAFDVYKAVGGGDRLRVWTMNFFRFGFVIGMGVAVVLSLLGDRSTYRKGNLRPSWHRLKASPLADPAIWAQLKDYNRADFIRTTATRPGWWDPGGRDSSVRTAH